MKRFILVLSVISILFLAGCSLNENVENNNVASGDMNNQIIDEEQTFGSKDNTSFTNEQLIEKIKIYRENRGEYIPEFIVIDSESGDIVTLHLYDDMGTHIATSDWYYINRNTGKGENLLGEVIDLNKIDFLERTSAFFNKQEEINGDRLRQEFSNISLVKKDKNYELKADLVGDVKIDTVILENAMKEIETKKLEKVEIKTTSEETVVIYGRKPQEIIDWHESIKNDPEVEQSFALTGVPTYDDTDWISAKNDDEWLNAEGVPMYVLYDGKYDGGWVIIQKEDDGYYLYGRELAGRDTMWLLQTINEKDAISLTLLADDKIILDINDFYGNLPDDFKAKELTVEEYYNFSPKDGTTKIIEDNLAINISNMSDSNYYDIGLEIKDEAIHIIARCDGP